MSLRNRCILGIVVFLGVLTAAAAARADTLQKLSFEQLVAAADLIVKGRVQEVNSRPSRKPRATITAVTVSVEQQFKGSKSSVVTVAQSGGAAGDVALGVPGNPEFFTGEDVILFLKRQRDGGFKVVGGKQGKFSARVEPSNGKATVEDFAHRSEALDTFLERLANLAKTN